MANKTLNNSVFYMPFFKCLKNNVCEGGLKGSWTTPLFKRLPQEYADTSGKYRMSPQYTYLLKINGTSL